MKHTHLLLRYTCLLLLCLLPAVSASAHFASQHQGEFTSQHQGKFTFQHQGKNLQTGPQTFYVDATLSETVASPNSPYLFRSLRDALRAAEDKPGITLYIAPGVYWIDNPDDAEVRQPLPGENIPYGMKLKVNNLSLIGLTTHPQEVIIASNRGQTLGAVGNFTMLHFDGDDIRVENLTFGNYCNVDLVYPLNEKLNRKKRSETIVQAQLIICNSDRVVARNCHFISRLNSCPFAGARRALFDNCYFECTDDALCGTGVYLNSRFTFFSGKPFYSTQGTGAVFLNCDIHSLTRGRQYLVKVGSPVSMVDCRWTSDDPDLFIGWTQDPTDDLRSYQHNLTLNGKPLFMDRNRPWLTVDMTGKPVLDAYRLTVPKALFGMSKAAGDTVIYNLCNLLAGYDDWDPTHQKPLLKKLGKQTGTALSKWTNKAIRMQLSLRKAEIETGVDSVLIKDSWLRYGTKPQFDEKVIKSPTRWRVSSEDSAYIELKKRNDGSCLVKGTNNSEETRTVNVIAYGGNTGLEAACVVTVKPRFLEAPAFLRKPSIKVDVAEGNRLDEGKLLDKDKLPAEGNMHVEGNRPTKNNRSPQRQLFADYQLDLQGRADQSLITWYRCTDAAGSNAIPVAVSRLNEPKRAYTLSPADNGYYIKVSVAPKHLRCHAGRAESAITATPVSYPGEKYSVSTDFQDFPTDYQPRILPGFWTVDGYKPADTQEFNWTPDPQHSWIYDKGVDGAAHDTGLLQATKGARLLYTPVENTYQDMQVILTVDPCKTAGQGFGSATGQYMDVYIKFDTRTLTGYGLRIIRTTKYDKAVDFVLMRYENGIATPISRPVSSICYRTGCTLMLSVSGNRFSVHAETSTPLPAPHKPELTRTVDLEADIIPNAYGGTGIQHTGSTGASATMLRNMVIKW